MTPHVLELAKECDFAITDNDEGDAVVRGQDVDYIGSLAECVAFMTAWQQCQRLKVAKTLKEAEAGLNYGILSLNSSGWQHPNVLAAATVTVTARPQVKVFRGHRIAIPDHLADNFTIENIAVGNQSVLVQSGSIPGSAFAARIPGSLAEFAFHNANGVARLEISKAALLEFGKPMTMPPCQMSQDLIMQVTNISGQALPFRAYILGKYA